MERAGLGEQVNTARMATDAGAAALPDAVVALPEVPKRAGLPPREGVSGIVMVAA